MANKTPSENEEFDTDREVGGIVYKMTQTYGTDNVAKEMAKTEAYFNQIDGRYARAMRVLGGDFKGHWACYVSRVRKGE